MLDAHPDGELQCEEHHYQAKKMHRMGPIRAATGAIIVCCGLWLGSVRAGALPSQLVLIGEQDYAVATPGDLIWLDPYTPYLYHGEQTIDHDTTNGQITVNGKPIGVDATGLDGPSAARVISRYRGSTLVVVIDRAKRLSPALITALRGCSAKQILLSLPRFHGADELRHLQRVGPKLVGLSLTYGEFGDAPLRHLAPLTWLRMLNLRNTKVTLRGLAVLRRLPLITHLDLSENPIGDGVTPILVRLNRLRYLRMDSVSLTDLGLRDLGRITSLQVLRLWGSTVTDAGMAQLAKLVQLRWLSVVWSRRMLLHPHQRRSAPISFTSTGLKQLRSLRQLVALDVTQSGVTDSGLPYLASLPRLQVLALYGNAITATGLPQLRPLKRLRILNLAHTPIGDAGLAELGRWQGLHTLSLSRTGITDQGLRHLRRLHALRVLRLDENPIGDGAAKWLSLLPRLRVLDLRDTRLTGSGVILLAKIRDLRQLNLFLTHARGQAALRALGTLRQLRALTLWRGAGAYLTPLVALSRLVRLSPGCNVTPQSLAALAKLTTLRHLTLQCRQVTDQGLARLSSLPQLQSLFLNGASITDAALRTLPRSLRWINLIRTPIGDAGLAHLEHHPFLVELNLIGTRVTALAVQRFNRAHPNSPARANP